MKNKASIADILLIAALVFVAAAMMLGSRLFSKEGAAVEVTLREQVYATLPLSRDAELDVDGLCLVKISGGRAWVEEAVCKNQICVKHPPISRAGQAIVCLPSEVTLKVLGEGADFYI